MTANCGDQIECRELELATTTILRFATSPNLKNGLAGKIGQLFATAPVCDVVTFGGRQKISKGGRSAAVSMEREPWP